MARGFWAPVVIALLVGSPLADAQDRDALVRRDRERFGSSVWIYNDLDQGLARARLERKPLLVVFRCIPCEACKEFDEEVAQRNPAVSGLMDRFVGVRLVQANRADLTRFRHDFDQSFAVYFLTPAGSIIGRYGTRSGRPESSDMDLDGFKAALTSALEVFEKGDDLEKSLAGKQVTPDEIRTPDDFPSLAGKYPATLDYQSKTARGCLHCHQVAEAFRSLHRDRGEPVPDRVLFPYPDPSVLGLSMSPKECALVLSVDPTSSAARDGFRAGDRILALEGQPLVSVADFQWVLHQSEDPKVLLADVQREDASITIPLSLEPGFRRRGDLSWRASSWDLRRMALGGMRLEGLLRAERKALGIAEDRLALRLSHVGEYGDHAVARNAGARPGDILISFDGDDTRHTETDLLAHALQVRKRGDEVKLKLLRDGKVVEIAFQLQ